MIFFFQHKFTVNWWRPHTWYMWSSASYYDYKARVWDFTRCVPNHGIQNRFIIGGSLAARFKASNDQYLRRWILLIFLVSCTESHNWWRWFDQERKRRNEFVYRLWCVQVTLYVHIGKPQPNTVRLMFYHNIGIGPKRHKIRWILLNPTCAALMIERNLAAKLNRSKYCPKIRWQMGHFLTIMSHGQKKSWKRNQENYFRLDLILSSRVLRSGWFFAWVEVDDDIQMINGTWFKSEKASFYTAALKNLMLSFLKWMCEAAEVLFRSDDRSCSSCWHHRQENVVF
jgi:hypothetical protein